MLRRADGAGFDSRLASLDNAAGNFLDHLLEQQPQVRVWIVVGRRDVFDAVGVG